MLYFPARQSRRPILKRNLRKGSCLRTNLLMRRFVLFVPTNHIFSPPKLYIAHTDARPVFPHITNVNTDFLLTMLSDLCRWRTFPIGSNNLRWICSSDLLGTQHRRPDHRTWWEYTRTASGGPPRQPNKKVLNTNYRSKILGFCQTV